MVVVSLTPLASTLNCTVTVLSLCTVDVTVAATRVAPRDALTVTGFVTVTTDLATVFVTVAPVWPLPVATVTVTVFVACNPLPLP